MNFNLNKEKNDKIKEIYEKVFGKLSIECDRIGNVLPYISYAGNYHDAEVEWWTNGFWSGIMWQLFNVTRDDKFKNSAINVEKRLSHLLTQYEKLDHDVGFMWLHTSVANYRQTENEQSKQEGLTAAGILASRYHVEGKFIRAWNEPRSCSMIIDCLMNLPLLYWASEMTQDSVFLRIGEHHTETVLQHIVRMDGSCEHIVEMDQLSGDCLSKPGGQGYGVGSSWARGQSWGIYGLALAYRYLKKDEYLQVAKKIAHYFIANIALTNYVSVIDFKAPKEPVYMDSTATAIAACGLLELSEHLVGHERALYVESAYKMLMALYKNYMDLDTETDGILTHGSAKYHRESDREVKIIYGDYFLLELILRFLDKGFLIW